MANDTLALTADWDLDLDDRGDMRTIGDGTAASIQTGPGMRLAQDVASRTRAWRGEVWFDTQQGVDYPRYLGLAPSVLELRTDFQNEAMRVPECASALADFGLNRTTRAVTGTLYLSDLSGFAAEVTV